MAEGEGRELRLALGPGGLPRVQSHPLLRALTQGRPRAQQLSCAFFDTSDLDLAQNGLELRIRPSGRSFAQLVEERRGSATEIFGEGPSDPLARRSGEAGLPEARPSPERIPDPVLRERVAGILGDRPLLPLFEISVRRTRRQLQEDENALGLVVDEGEIRAGDRRLPLQDVRLELHRGSVSYLYRLALELQEEVPIRLQTQGLRLRGEALATGERPTPQRAARLALSSDATVEELLSALVQSGLQQLLANELPAWEGNDPEGVHQLRVGVRRLRATLALFGRMLPERENALLKQELRWLGGALGPARDLDVFLDDLMEPVTRRFPDVPGLKRLRDEARELHEESYSHVRAALDSPRQARLGLILHRWWAVRAWRNQPLSPEAARLFSPAVHEVAALIAKRHRRALRLGADVTARSVAEKHVLRIQLKKLRYASDAARSLFPRRRAERYASRLADLQDVLGHLNDVAAAESLLARILERLGREAGPVHHHAAGFVAGWAAHVADRRLRRLERLWKDFARTKPFWHE